jgi:hypothetical protein
MNFYGNYRVYHSNPGKVHWITRKMIIHRNLPTIEFWGDGSNVKLSGQRFHWETSSREFTVHHFGGVKPAGRLRRLQWIAGRCRAGRSVWWCPPQIVFDLFPYDWMDRDYLDDLAIYDGPLIRPVREHPEQYACDGMKLFNRVSARKTSQLGEASIAS